MLRDEPVQLVGVGALTHDVDRVVAEQPHHAGPDQHGVIDHHYPHGITTFARSSSMSSVPPTAPTLSRRWMQDARVHPWRHHRLEGENATGVDDRHGQRHPVVR